MRLARGITQIYTGDGKGKSTAAAGSAARALGRGLTVHYYQFFKQPPSGEIRTLAASGSFRFTRVYPFHPSFQTARRRAGLPAFRKEWDLFLSRMEREESDMVVLDELLIAVRDGYVGAAAVARLLARWRAAHPRMEIIVTGRGATPGLRKAADLVTEMRCVKHPYPRVTARKGIEY
jgi:cob(I)alamin adenosyltransferase